MQRKSEQHSLQKRPYKGEKEKLWEEVELLLSALLLTVLCLGLVFVGIVVSVGL